MASLDDLAVALRAGAQGKADLAGTEAAFTRASNLANTQVGGPAAAGGANPYADVLSYMRRDRGNRQLEAVEPQRATARQAIADSASALPLYQAGVAADKVTQDQENFESSAEAKLTAASALAKAKAREDQLKRDREDKKSPLVSKVDPESGKERTIRYNAQTGTATLDGEVITNFSEWTDPVKKTSEINVAGYGTPDIDKRGTDAILLMGQANRIANKAKGLSDQAKNELNSGSTRFKEVFLNTFSPQKAKALIKSEYSGYSQEAKDFITSLSRMSAAERKALFGSQVTQGEQESSEDFLNRVEGLNFDQVMGRLEDTYMTNLNNLGSLDIAGGGTRFVDAVSKADWDAFDPPEPEAPAVPVYTPDQLMAMSEEEFAAYEASIIGAGGG